MAPLPNAPQTPTPMPKEDRRNLVWFLILSATIWFLYDHFILAPRMEAHRQAQLATEAAATPTAATEKVETVRPRADVLAGREAVTFENSRVRGSIALVGGRIDDVSLTTYKQTQGGTDPVSLFSPAGTEFPEYAEFGWIAEDGQTAVPDKTTRWTIKPGSAQSLTKDQPMVLIWDNGAGLTFERVLTLSPDYLVTVTQRVINHTQKPVDLRPYALISRHGFPQRSDGPAQTLYAGPVGYMNDDLVEPGFNGMMKEPQTLYKSTGGWIGFTHEYWISALLPAQGEESQFRLVHVPASSDKAKPRFQVDVTGPVRSIAPGEIGENTVNLYAGAKIVKLLGHYESTLGVTHLDLAVNFGLLYFLTYPLYLLMVFIGEQTGNFGVAILGLTLISRLLVFPLANKSYRSFARLKQVTPQIVELRKKYGDDKTRLQKEMAELYGREKVNPLAGCLPILVQMPIFFALYRVLSMAIEMRHAPFFGWIHDLSAYDPLTVFNLFGLLPWEVPGFLHLFGPWHCLMILFMYVQQSLYPPPQDAGQRMTMRIMPLFVAWLMSSAPVGLAIYWAFGNFLSIVQQITIMSMMGTPIHLFTRTKDEEKLEELVSKGPALNPGADLLEKDVETALFGKEDAPDGKDGK